MSVLFHANETERCEIRTRLDSNFQRVPEKVGFHFSMERGKNLALPTVIFNPNIFGG